MRRNMLRELLDAGKPTIGTHMITNSPRVVEIIGYTKCVDYIELCGEYTDWGLTELENFARATELFPEISSMMKVEQEPRVFITTRALDAGIQNILIADCHSADEVKESIRAVLPETPQDNGLHGCAMRRNVGYLFDCGNEAWAQAQRDTVIAIMIEKASAMEQIDEILSIKHVDMVQFGPCDYAISIGKPGQGGSPEVQKVQRDMIEKAISKGVHPRVEIENFDEAREYMDMGVRHFCIGYDLSSIYEFIKLNGEKLRQALNNGIK